MSQTRELAEEPRLPRALLPRPAGNRGFP